MAVDGLNELMAKLASIPVKMNEAAKLALCTRTPTWDIRAA